MQVFKVYVLRLILMEVNLFDLIYQRLLHRVTSVTNHCSCDVRAEGQDPY